MAPKEVESAWQLECSEIKQRGERVLSAGRWADCWFEVGADRARRPAHKLLLGMASPVFEAMFYGPLAAAASEPVAVPDIEPHTFDLMLQYIYTDSINITTCNIARAVYLAEHKYMLPHLMAKCTSFMSHNLGPETVCTVYEFAQFVEEDKLRNECVEMMQNETSDVLKAASFVEAQEETVAQLFSLEPLNIESELQLLAAAERWTRARVAGDAEAGGSAAAASHSQEAAPEGQPTCRGAVNNIRFLTLTAREIAEHPNVTSLLTGLETMAILMNIASKDTPVPMPNGFSICRTSRKQMDCKSRPEAMVEIEVDISNLNTFHSDTFYVRDLPWRVKIFRHSQWLNVRAECNWEGAASGWSCQAEVELHLLSHVPHRSSCIRVFDRLFNSVSNSWGYDCFVVWNELTGPVLGYVRDGDNKIRFKVIVKTQSSLSSYINTSEPRLFPLLTTEQ